MPPTAMTVEMCSHCCDVWLLQSVHVPRATWVAVQATFLEGSQITAVTADSRGRLVFHNVTAYLSLTSIFTGLTKAAQPSLLTDGRQLGPLCVLAALPAPKPHGSPPAGCRPPALHPGRRRAARVGRHAHHVLREGRLHWCVPGTLGPLPLCTLRTALQSNITDTSSKWLAAGGGALGIYPDSSSAT